MMFITNMEIPVLITALIAITSDLGGFDDVSWVVSSYLLGYVGTLNQFPVRHVDYSHARGDSRHHNLCQVQRHFRPKAHLLAVHRHIHHLFRRL